MLKEIIVQAQKTCWKQKRILHSTVAIQIILKIQHHLNANSNVDIQNSTLLRI